MKKLTSYILSLVLIFSAVISVSAVEIVEKTEPIDTDLWVYSICGQTAEINGYKGSEKNVVIPEKINNFTVTSIASAAFYNSNIEKISFPPTVETIGWWSFYGCNKLKEVRLNNGLKTIGFGAFINCPELKQINLPYTVSSIGEDAFAVSCSTQKDIKDSYSKKTVSRQDYSVNTDFNIIGFENTFPEKYAKQNNLLFTAKGRADFCDADLNGTADYNDIILLEKYLSGAIQFDSQQFRNCDVDGDAKVTHSDAELIKKYIRCLISFSELPVAKGFSQKPNYLAGKTIYCDGDSVAKGTGTNIFGSDFYSYCNYVSEKYGMVMVNNSVAGTTLAKQRNKTKPENMSILERVEAMEDDYDVILLEGGFNDLFQKIEIGEMTEPSDKSGIYDDYTTAGALESICYFLNENYPDSVKLFVLCHKRNASPNQSKYWSVITDILEKWNIDYVDISTETEFSDINDEISTQYFQYNKGSEKGDGIHPLQYAAEKIYGSVISDKLNDLAGESFEISFEEDEVELGLFESYYQQPVKSEALDDVKLQWSSDNPLVASVDSDGTVTARCFGTTSIRLCTSDGKTASYKVNVNILVWIKRIILSNK